MKSIQTYLSILKKTNSGQLALARANTPARCGRVPTQNSKEGKEVGGQLTPAGMATWFGRFSIRSLKTTKPTTYGQSVPVMMPAKLGRPQREPHPDTFFGHERTAKMSAQFIHDLFKCSEAFCDGATPDDAYPTLTEFISYALFRSDSDIYVHYYAMYLIWRMHIKDPELRARQSHEVYLAALMLAKRMVSPERYASESWSEVGQSIFSSERLQQNERRLCAAVNWEVEVNVTRVGIIEDQIEMKYAESAISLESESSDEWSDSDDSSSLFSVETPDTTPLPSDSVSPCPSHPMPVGECVWW